MDSPLLHEGAAAPRVRASRFQVLALGTIGFALGSVFALVIFSGAHDAAPTTGSASVTRIALFEVDALHSQKQSSQEVRPALPLRSSNPRSSGGGIRTVVLGCLGVHCLLYGSIGVLLVFSQKTWNNARKIPAEVAINRLNSSALRSRGVSMIGTVLFTLIYLSDPIMAMPLCMLWFIFDILTLLVHIQRRCLRDEPLSDHLKHGNPEFIAICVFMALLAGYALALVAQKPLPMGDLGPSRGLVRGIIGVLTLVSSIFGLLLFFFPKSLYKIYGGPMEGDWELAPANIENNCHQSGAMLLAGAIWSALQIADDGMANAVLVRFLLQYSLAFVRAMWRVVSPGSLPQYLVSAYKKQTVQCLVFGALSLFGLYRVQYL